MGKFKFNGRTYSAPDIYCAYSLGGDKIGFMSFDYCYNHGSQFEFVGLDHIFISTKDILIISNNLEYVVNYISKD